MSAVLSDKVRILHILDAIAEVEGYFKNVSKDQFLASSEKRFATIKQIEIVGKACNRITDAFKLTHPEMEWRSVNGFRNISIHEYFGVNFQVGWEIAAHDLPVLKQKFISVLPAG